MKKNQIRIYTIVGILFLVFSTISFVLPVNRNSVFVLAYLFGIISIMVLAYAVHVGVIKEEGAHSKFYGFPIAYIGMVYTGVQLVLSFLFMFISSRIPVRVVIIICVVLLAIAIVGLIAAEVVKEEVVHQEEKLKANVGTMRTLQSRVRAMTGICEAKMLKVFAEELQYSDPVSCEELKEVEEELGEIIVQLQKAVNDSDQMKIDELAKKGIERLQERNLLCKSYKGKN